MRFRGMAFIMLTFSSGAVVVRCSKSSVFWVGPGMIVFTRTPCGAPSRAAVLVRVFSPALLAE